MSYVVSREMVEIRPANGTPDELHEQGFVGVFGGDMGDGTIRVITAGEVPDLTHAVFLRGMTRAEFEAAMK